jgi:hypothetical protein
LYIKDQASQQPILISQFDARTETKILGFQMAPEHIATQQKKALVEKARNFANLINTSHLSSEDKIVAYHSVLWPGITYPLAGTSLSIRDLKQIGQKHGMTIRHALHLNKPFPDALIWS